MTAAPAPPGSDPLADRVPRDAPGAREIGFSCPERYNASEILFANLAEGRGERPAVWSPAVNHTYASLAALAGRYGNALLALGLARGERVALVLDDTPAYPAALMGAIRAGLVPVLVNTLTPPDLLAYYLADSGGRVAIADAQHLPLVRAAVDRGARLESIVIAESAEAPLTAVRARLGDTFVIPGDALLRPADTHRDEMAFWMYSSGSTGRPKGIVHLQHDMAYTAASYERSVLALAPDDVCFSVPKIFFAYGLGNSITFPFAAGASSVLYPGRPEPAAVLRAIAHFRPSVFFALPTLYTALVNAPEAAGADLSSIRLEISAAEVLPGEVAAAWKRLSGREIVEGLGSTEVLHIYLSNTTGARRAGSAGRRVPGYEVSLRDPDGREVADGEAGILWVRGDSSAPCYWNRPDKTAETMREGWIWTGDRFVRDAQGFHYFRGRADDLVKVSGQWVLPQEVEQCLAEHPKVRECAVLAAPLGDGRTTLRAFVVSHRREDATAAVASELQDFVKGRLMPYKYPRLITYLAELPKTGTGKIDRQALLRIPAAS
jgi:acetyl-CoA synthetase